MNVFRKMSRSLAWRMALPVGIVVAMAVSLHILLLSSQKELYRRKLRESERVGKIIQAILLYDMSRSNMHDFQTYIKMLPLGEDLYSIRIYNNAGYLQYAVNDSSIGQRVDKMENPVCIDCHRHPAGTPIKKMNLRKSPKGMYVFQADFPLENSAKCRLCHTATQKNLGNLLTELTLSTTDMRFINSRKILIFAGASVMVLAIAFMVIAFQSQVVRPIKKLVSVIEQSKKGKFNKRYHLSRKDEIGYLVNAFNEMMDAILELQSELEAKVEARTKELESSRVQLLFRENLASLGRMAAGIAHELGNPLTGISAIVQLIKRRKKEDPFVVEQLDLVHEEIKRISRLSRQLVDLARPEDTGKTIFNIKDSLNKAYQVARYDKRVNKRIVRLPENKGPIWVEANEDAVIQIIMNLFFNAADATADNGFIRIDVKSGKNSVAEIRVIDNGKGIPEEDRLRIFDPFFSSKGMTGGIGLGLSVSLSLARSFNGNLILESSDENGSAFLLTVPLIEG